MGTVTDPLFIAAVLVSTSVAPDNADFGRRAEVFISLRRGQFHGLLRGLSLGDESTMIVLRGDGDTCPKLRVHDVGR